MIRHYIHHWLGIEDDVVRQDVVLAKHGRALETHGSRLDFLSTQTEAKIQRGDEALWAAVNDLRTGALNMSDRIAALEGDGIELDEDGVPHEKDDFDPAIARACSDYATMIRDLGKRCDDMRVERDNALDTVRSLGERIVGYRHAEKNRIHDMKTMRDELRRLRKAHAELKRKKR